MSYTKPPSMSEERTIASIAHLSATIAWVFSAGVLTLVGPLILWAVYRDRSSFVRTAAAGAFNFAITMTVLSIVGWVMVITLILLPLGALLIGVSGLGAIVLGILGALRTWGGDQFLYPMQVPVLR